jgi:predicted MPP superfamily phosphohydrolase
LPNQKISFGAWQAQWMIFTIPRLCASFGLAILALLVGDVWGFWLFVGVQTLGTLLFLWGAIYEPFRLGVSEILVLSDRLPIGTPAIRVLHISDLHVEKLTRREEKVVEISQRLRPDIIVMTGDYLNISYNHDPETLMQTKKLLRQFSAPHGVFATLGSPSADYRKTAVPLFDGVPITLLRQSWEVVNLGRGRKVVVLGVDCTHLLPLDAAHLAELMQDVPADLPQILLYHSPELMPQATEFGVDLYLCGHTHGGQVRLPLIGPLLTSSQLGRRFVMGLYKIGRTHLYVSRGVGLEGLSAPRVRLLCPPEMTLVTIVPNGVGEE